MTTQHFKLQNISCSSCVMHLEAMEDNLPGVQTVDVNLRQLTMKVDFLEGEVTPDDIAQAVAAMGYAAAAFDPTETKDKKGTPWNRLFRS